MKGKNSRGLKERRQREMFAINERPPEKLADKQGGGGGGNVERVQSGTKILRGPR